MKVSEAAYGVWVIVAAALFFYPVPRAQAAPIPIVPSHVRFVTSHVRFRESWQGQMMAFTDGSAVEILNPGFKIKLPEWKVGTRLEILFNPTQGVRVFNPKTHQTFQVLELYNRPHPIDLWLRRCETKYMSNSGDEACLSHAETMWEQLISFDYNLVLHNETPGATLAGFKKALLANEQDWLAYRRSFSEVVENSFAMWGTSWPIYAGQVYDNMLRNQDRIVLSLLGTVMPFSTGNTHYSPRVPNLR